MRWLILSQFVDNRKYKLPPQDQSRQPSSSNECTEFVLFFITAVVVQGVVKLIDHRLTHHLSIHQSLPLRCLGIYRLCIERVIVVSLALPTRPTLTTLLVVLLVEKVELLLLTAGFNAITVLAIPFAFLQAIFLLAVDNGQFNG